MKKFFHQARGELHNMFNDDSPASSHHHGQQHVLANPPPPISAPTRDDIIRYRYHHGVNLGSVYVLEKWLHPSMFPPDAPPNQTAELAGATLALKQLGPDGARKKFEDHWANSLTDSDMDWLVNQAHCTSIRLPIGYFTLGPSFCKGTPFDKVSAVYTNAWSSVRSLVSRCSAHGIGVLVDFHALPGGANGGEHSGTNSGKAEFWGNKSNVDLANRCLQFIAQEIRHMDGVVGLQLCNEAEYNAAGMYAWYDSVINQIGAIDNTIPIYISDAWNMGQAVDYIRKKNSLACGYSNPIIIDTHLYWAFSDADKSKSPQAIIGAVPSTLRELDGKDGNVGDHGAAAAVVGEYSCVLDGQTWDKSGGASREQLVQQFGCAQSQRHQQRSGGSYFWTYKMVCPTCSSICPVFLPFAWPYAQKGWLLTIFSRTGLDGRRRMGLRRNDQEKLLHLTSLSHTRLPRRSAPPRYRFLPAGRKDVRERRQSQQLLELAIS